MVHDASTAGLLNADLRDRLELLLPAMWMTVSKRKRPATPKAAKVAGPVLPGAEPAALS